MLYVREAIIRLINTVDTSQVITLKEHTHTVWSLAYDPKNKYLASAAADGTILVSM